MIGNTPIAANGDSSEKTADETRRIANPAHAADDNISDAGTKIHQMQTTMELHSQGTLSPGTTDQWYGPSLGQEHHNDLSAHQVNHQIFLQVRVPGFGWSERKCLTSLLYAVRRHREITVPITLLDGMNRPLELQMELSV